jgi:hypothetical protein
MNKKTLDYNFGINKETYFLDKLKNKFSTDVLPVKEKFCSYDFESDGCIFELKSRRCLKETYPSTMIGMNKIKKYQSLNKRIILCFSFIDVDCYYEYNPNDNLIVKNGGRNDRGKDEYNDYLYIPINLLKDF